MTHVEINVANVEEREACYRLAYEIYCEEVGSLREQADHANRTLRDPMVESADLISARIDGELVGSIAVLFRPDAGFQSPFEERFEVDRFLTLVRSEEIALTFRFLVKEAFRGSVAPFRLIQATIRFMVEHGGKVLLADCQPHLLNLYMRLGCRPYAPTLDQPGYGLMVPLVLVLVDFAHLRSVGSPLIKLLPDKYDDSELTARVRSALPERPPVIATSSLNEEAWSEAFGILEGDGSRPSLFEELTATEVRTVARMGQILTCSRNQRVILRGQGARTMYVVLEGEVEVRNDGVPIARMFKGEPFGEIAFLLGAKRTADVVATSDRVELVALNERTVSQLIESHSTLAAKLLLNLSRSLALKLVDRAG